MRAGDKQHTLAYMNIWMHARIKLPCGQLIQTISSNISVTLERQQPGLEQLLYDKFFNKKKNETVQFLLPYKQKCMYIN